MRQRREALSVVCYDWNLLVTSKSSLLDAFGVLGNCSGVEADVWRAVSVAGLVAHGIGKTSSKIGMTSRNHKPPRTLSLLRR